MERMPDLSSCRAIPKRARLIDAIGHGAAIKMPPRSKLPPQAIADLTKWVQMGLPWPESSHELATDRVRESAADLCETALGVSAGRGSGTSCGQRESMAPDFGRSVHSREARSQRNSAFIAGGQADLDPPRDVRLDGPAADARGSRLRSRPTSLPAHSIGWSSGCWLRLRYGERWGRYWLDVARYADTKGYILFQDANYHWAYTYRDYVIARLQSRRAVRPIFDRADCGRPASPRARAKDR